MGSKFSRLDEGPPQRFDAIRARLQKTELSIREIVQISGTVGLSVGVCQDGKVIHQVNYGFRDLEAKAAPDGDTIYHICSLTKFFTCAALAHLVEDGCFAWRSCLKEILPGFARSDEQDEVPSNLIDILAHRMALEGRNPLWFQKNNQLLLPQTDDVAVFNDLARTGCFRKTFLYNNWAYSCTEDIVQHTVGMTLTEVMQQRIFGPLGLKNTSMETSSRENMVRSYQTLSDGSAVQIPPPGLASGTICGAGGGLKSSVHDLLYLYDKFLQGAADQKSSGRRKSECSPFVDTKSILERHMFDGHRTGCGLGWFEVITPAPMGLVGMNPSLLKTMPLIGKGTRSKVYYHNGSMPGALSSVHLVPESRTTIVVLSNTTPSCDVTDWIGCLLLEAVLDAPEPNDYVALTIECVERMRREANEVVESLEASRTVRSPIRQLSDYCGKYWNSIGNFCIQISPAEDGLLAAMQGQKHTTYHLLPHTEDVFYWPPHRDRELSEAMFPLVLNYTEIRKMSFRADECGNIVALAWKYAPDLPEYASIFTKSVAVA